jgi:hypothetical protein
VSFFVFQVLGEFRFDFLLLYDWSDFLKRFQRRMQPLGGSGAMPLASVVFTLL